MPRIECIRGVLYRCLKITINLSSTHIKSKWNLHLLPPYTFMANAVTILSLFLHILKLQGLRSKERSLVQIQGLSKRFEHLLLWPPRSPDLTPCDFFLWGYVKDTAYKPPLPQNVRELQDRIRAAVQTTDGNMLKRVWQERLSY